MFRVFTYGVQSQFESYQGLQKWCLMPPCLTLSIIRFGSRVNCCNAGKGVTPSPTSWCSSYQKWSLRVTDYGCQFYLLYFLSNKSLLYEWVASILNGSVFKLVTQDFFRSGWRHCGQGLIVAIVYYFQIWN